MVRTGEDEDQRRLLIRKLKDYGRRQGKLRGAG